jgi:hypothetical protein
VIIPIGRDEASVFAMGHRVDIDQGGVRELKRRCLAALAQLNDPPDEVRFETLWLAPTPAPAHESGEHSLPGICNPDSRRVLSAAEVRAGAWPGPTGPVEPPQRQRAQEGRKRR